MTDSYAVDTFANRNDARPIIAIQRPSEGQSSDNQQGKHVAAVSAKDEGTASDNDVGDSHKRSRSLQDRLLTKLVHILIDHEA